MQNAKCTIILDKGVAKAQNDVSLIFYITRVEQLSVSLFYQFNLIFTFKRRQNRIIMYIPNLQGFLTAGLALTGALKNRK